MRSRLRPAVKAEHGFDNADQLVWQMDRANATTIGAAGIMELLQIYSEGLIELSDIAGKDHGATRRIFLYHGQAMTGSEGLDGGDVARVGAKLLREIIAPKVAILVGPARKPFHAFFQCVILRATQNQADFQPFCRICLAGGLRPRHRLPLTTFQGMVRHGVSPRMLGQQPITASLSGFLMKKTFGEPDRFLREIAWREKI
jgi:hypothetical protein